jgi:hypothetical protein
MENKWEISPEESETTSKSKDVMKEAKIYNDELANLRSYNKSISI